VNAPALALCEVEPIATESSRTQLRELLAAAAVTTLRRGA
jgi:hypothetical protein